MVPTSELAKIAQPPKAAKEKKTKEVTVLEGFTGNFIYGVPKDLSPESVLSKFTVDEGLTPMVLDFNFEVVDDALMKSTEADDIMRGVDTLLEQEATLTVVLFFFARLFSHHLLHLTCPTGRWLHMCI